MKLTDSGEVKVNPPIALVTGQIANLVVCAEDWTNPSPTGRGMFFIYMNAIPETPAVYKRVAIPSTHPAYETVYKFALTAWSTGSNIALRYIQSHVTRANSWDFASISIVPTN